MNNNIIIKDWTGNILYEGDKDHPNVDKVLEANRCKSWRHGTYDDCNDCDGTGYSGDFEVYWQDENRRDNVYEFISY